TPTMNFLEGTVAADGPRRMFRANGLEHPLPDAVPANCADRRVMLGVRSEDVIVNGGGGLRGEVRLTEPLGDATLVFFESGQPSPLVAKVPPGAVMKPGMALSFRFVPEHCHLFDAADGSRLH